MQFLVTAFSLDGKEQLNAIFELNVLNVDEYWPQFAHSLQAMAFTIFRSIFSILARFGQANIVLANGFFK
jgi:hypothetical protein